MKEDQQQKCHVCRFCKQGFSDGKKLGGHMRCHLALITACKTNQAAINGEKDLDLHNDHDHDDQIIGKQGIDFDDVMVKKRQQELDSGANVYVLRQNPKRSWRVCSSSKDHDLNSGKESMEMKNTVCDKCGKVFESMRALYGHMRCHSIKRSRPLNESSSEEHQHEHEHGVVNPVGNKRLCTRYKYVKHDDDDYEAERGAALCLMMLSRGVRSLEGVELGRVGLGRMLPGRVGSTLVKYKSTKEESSIRQDSENEKYRN